ncbi:hypothetical protein DBV15_04798 [Temnothorax longispinosus]|uniref:Uncharacterized protein n=1 Tax=Temnothorax longispinosus TaxID=300112 RepID=A0A4S2JNT4_9HYME|nr:hypothetical protein DBV15_04798 [Temnothorax longispinosus]
MRVRLLELTEHAHMAAGHVQCCYMSSAERHFFLPDSFVLCKNASIKPNCIDFCAEVAKLKNYPTTKHLGRFDLQITTERRRSYVMFDDEDNNGLVLCDKYLPVEVLIEIFCHADCQTLLRC